MPRFKMEAFSSLLMLCLLAMPTARSFQYTECVMRPDNDAENVIEDSKTVSLECSFDAPVAGCTIYHNEPEQDKNSAEYDFECGVIQDSTDKYCHEDNTVSTMISDVSCGFTIGNTRPEHTGRWYLTAQASANPSVQTAQGADYTFTLYTYNQSTVYLLDEEERDVDNDLIDTSYNYNERNNDWEDDMTGWETLEFIARGYGGRPEPLFHWYIDNRGNDLKEDYGDVFRVSTGSLGCDDDYGFICNMQSTITFSVDDRLMEVLDEIGIETNPNDEQVRFTLYCEVEQDATTFVQTMRVELNVEKSYDNGALPASTIGIIVAVVIAVVILLIVVCILLMAKRSKRWCFAEEEGKDSYHTKDPRDPRSHQTKSAAPYSRSGAPRAGRDYRSSSGERSSRHHSSHQVQSTTIADNTSGLGAGAALSSSAAPLIKKTRTSSSSSSSSTTPDIRKQQQWTLPPKELRESLNKLNQRHAPGSSSSSLSTTPDTPRKKKKPAPLDLPNQNNVEEKRQPLFLKNSKVMSSSSSSHSPTTTTSHNKPTGATPKMHRGVWQSSPPYPQYQTTTDTSSSSNESSSTRRARSDGAPPIRPKSAIDASVSNRESVNYADLDLTAGSRKSFMQDPRNQVLPSFTVVPRQSPDPSPTAPPMLPPKGHNTVTTTMMEERTEYSSVVATSSYV